MIDLIKRTVLINIYFIKYATHAMTSIKNNFLTGEKD